MEREAATDDVRDVAVVGGGPAGCAVAVFTARYGLDTVVEDVRRERGYPEALAPHDDWVRHRAELTDEWADRDRWREWFDERPPEGSIDDDLVPRAAEEILAERGTTGEVTER